MALLRVKGSKSDPHHLTQGLTLEVKGLIKQLINAQHFNNFFLTAYIFDLCLASAAQNKDGTEAVDKNISLLAKKEESMPEKGNSDDVKSSKKAEEAGNRNNVIIEELGSPDVDSLQPDEMFDEDLQPSEGINIHLQPNALGLGSDRPPYIFLLVIK